VPDLTRAVEAKAGFMDALDLRPPLVVATGTRRARVGRLPGSARRATCSW
jgi:hypothetical protein